MEFVWRVSSVIQEGQKNIEIRLQKDEASGLKHLIVSVPLWINGNYGEKEHMPINVRTGLRNILLGMRNTIGDVVGLVEKAPKYSSYDVDSIIEKEKTKYAVASVTTASPGTNFAQIYDEEIMKKAEKLLVKIDEKVRADWDARKSEIEDPIRAQFYKEGEAVVQNALNIKLNEMILEGVSSERDQFDAINPGLADAILNRAKAIPLIYEGEQILAEHIAEEQARIEAEITAKNPIKSQIREWMREQVEKKMAPIMAELQKSNYEMIAATLEKNNLKDEANLVRAQYEFTTKHAEELRKNMNKEEVAAREFNLPIKTWQSKNWDITSYEAKNEETGQVETRYAANTYKDAKVVTSVPLWRLWAAWNTNRYILKNGLYHLVMTNLINGPLGIKHVYKDQPFSNQKRVNPKTGAIEADPNSITTTMRSRTRELWKSVADADAKFEASQPSGFFSKDTLRVIHNIKNRYIRGYIGTGVIWGCGGACAIGNTLATTGLGATSLVWAPMTSIFMLGFDAAVYDTKGASRRTVNRFSPLLTHLLGQSGIAGLGMTVGAGLGALTHATVGVGEIGLGRTRAGIIGGKDALMRKIFFRHAYVPKGNDMVTKLIAGPGLTSEYYYQVRPEISVMGLMATLEQAELQAYKKATQEEIDKPVKEFNEFFNRTLSQAVTVDLNATIRKYPDLVDSTSALSKDLEKAVSERSQLYNKILGNEGGVNRFLIKQTREDLAETLAISQSLVQEYFTEKVFAGMSAEQIAGFWRDRRLPQNEWTEFTKDLLAQTFSREFLTPLEDTDARFRFVVGNEGLERDLERLVDGKKIDDGSVKPVIDNGKKTDRESVRGNRIVVAQDTVPSVLLNNACKKALNKSK